jgi:cytochrome c-type biogenesis protein CcmH
LTRTRPFIAALLAALAVSVLFPPFGQGTETRASLPDIENEVMCLVCGTLLELSSAPQAERERAFIRRQIAAGKSKDEIKDALVGEYGPRVLAEPKFHGFDLTAWALPALGILAGITVVALTIRRRVRRINQEPAEAEEPTSADAARLEKELSSYGR